MNTSTLTPQEKARVFDLYPEDTKIIYLGDDNSDIQYKGRQTHNSRLIRESNANKGWKLLLTTLSEISDEDAIEVAKAGVIYSRSKINKGEVVNRTDSYVDIDLRDQFTFGVRLCFNGHFSALTAHGDRVEVEKSFMSQLLTLKGYAVPLFFAPNHPDNGKTAIEVGLAISKNKSHE